LVFIAVACAVSDNWFIDGTPENAALPKCTGPRIRKSWASLDNTARKAFVNLVWKAKQVKGQWTTGSTSSSPLFDVFPGIHKSSGNAIWHYTSAFIAAHKGFLWMYESALTWVCFKYGTTLSPQIQPEQCCEYAALPYWAWEADCDLNTKDTIVPIIDTSSIWDRSTGCPTCFGDPVTNPTTGYYVSSGMFTRENGWNILSPVAGDATQWQTSSAKYYDTGLKRLNDPSMMKLDQSQIATTIAANPSFSTMLPWCHGSGHSCTHLFLGFSMKTQSSPDEPMFFMHHGNVDRLFHLWADCWDYEGISCDSLGPNQYTEINPTPGGSAVCYTVGKDKFPYSVTVDTVIPYKFGSGSSTFIPEAKWPKIKDLWTCGEEGRPGWMGMYYRYGTDAIAQILSTRSGACKSNNWGWVNYGAGSKKRDADPEHNDFTDRDDNEAVMFREIQAEIIRKTEQEGLSTKAALRDIAMENCLKNTKPEYSPQDLAYLRMMGISPSSLDRICDEPSMDPLYNGHQHSM
jgi:tyrosinase